MWEFMVLPMVSYLVLRLLYLMWAFIFFKSSFHLSVSWVHFSFIPLEYFLWICTVSDGKASTLNLYCSVAVLWSRCTRLDFMPKVKAKSGPHVLLIWYGTETCVTRVNYGYNYSLTTQTYIVCHEGSLDWAALFPCFLCNKLHLAFLQGHL